MLESFCPHTGSEFLAVLFLGIAEFGFGQELALLERSATWVDNDKILVVNDTLKGTGRHVKHEA